MRSTLGLLLEFLGLIGLISLILSYIHFFRLNVACKFDEIGKRVVVDTTKTIKSHRKWFGWFYFIAGLFLVYIGFLWGR